MTKEQQIEYWVEMLSKKFIIFNPLYKTLTGSFSGAIMLSHLMYLYFKNAEKFCKTDMELRDELCMTERELKTSKSHIKQVKFLKITKEGTPCRTWYDVDLELFLNTMLKIDRELKKEKLKW